MKVRDKGKAQPQSWGSPGWVLAAPTGSASDGRTGTTHKGTQVSMDKNGTVLGLHQGALITTHWRVLCNERSILHAHLLWLDVAPSEVVSTPQSLESVNIHRVTSHLDPTITLTVMGCLEILIDSLRNLLKNHNLLTKYILLKFEDSSITQLQVPTLRPSLFLEAARGCVRSQPPARVSVPACSLHLLCFLELHTFRNSRN